MIFAIVGFTDKNLDTLLFRIEMVIMTFLVCFRYGQGSDYHNYESIFNKQSWTPGVSYDGEKLFAVINKIVVTSGWSYQFFVGIVGLLCMTLTYIGLQKLSPIKTVSTLLLLPAYYLTYYFSAIREGIALAVTLGVILPLILKKERLKAFIWIFIISLIHQSSIIMVVMLLDIPWHRIRRFLISVSAVCGIGLWVLLQFVTINIHELYFSPSYMAVVIRVIVFGIITAMFEKSEKTQKIYKMYDIYLIGFCVYLITFVSALFSQRGTAYFKIIEVILIPCMLGYVAPVSVADCRYAMRKLLFSGLIIISVVEGVKNLASYPRQLDYPEYISFQNYQYISIFNKEQEKLYKDGF